jgi:hypothetical protein
MPVVSQGLIFGSSTANWPNASVGGVVCLEPAAPSSANILKKGFVSLCCEVDGAPWVCGMFGWLSEG